MSEQQEILDLVDRDDNVIGQIDRDSAGYSSCINFRVINAFVVNPKGQIWIPRRTVHKRIFPDCLDMSVGGHVETGENYLTTFRRETEEELNIDIDEVTWRELGYLNPYQHGSSAFMRVYQIDLDQEPDYNHDDYRGAEWLYPREVLARIREGEKVKGDLGQLVRLFFVTKEQIPGT